MTKAAKMEKCGFYTADDIASPCLLVAYSADIEPRTEWQNGTPKRYALALPAAPPILAQSQRNEMTGLREIPHVFWPREYFCCWKALLTGDEGLTMPSRHQKISPPHQAALVKMLALWV